MPSVPIPLLKRALGNDFDWLYPKIQNQYGHTSHQNLQGVGKGQMTEISRGAFWFVPFLTLGTKRLLLFPEVGRDIPFTIENFFYCDPLGRETLTWTRRFEFARERRFDEYLTFSERRNGLVLYAGSHQHLAVELQVSVGNAGELCIKTKAQRLYEFPLGIRFPLLFSGTATILESYNDLEHRFEVDVIIKNSIFGKICAYKGWFHHEIRPCESIPEHVFPRRTESRD